MDTLRENARITHYEKRLCAARARPEFKNGTVGPAYCTWLYNQCIWLSRVTSYSWYDFWLGFYRSYVLANGPHPKSLFGSKLITILSLRIHKIYSYPWFLFERNHDSYPWFLMIPPWFLSWFQSWCLWFLIQIPDSWFRFIDSLIPLLNETLESLIPAFIETS